LTVVIKNLRECQPVQEFDFRVDRKSPLGNPFTTGKYSRDIVCDMYEEHFHNVMLKDSEVQRCLDRIIEAHRVYGGVNLFCWCVPLRCHAETIKRYLEEYIAKNP